ncbi:MAG: AAA family ATPase [Rubrivivax sp.]|nr:AAA family ATPase [Rubrivivax sp.]
MKFLHGDEFMMSLRDLYQKGGRFQRAAETVQAIWGRASMGGATFEDVFRGVAVTNHGESRVAHCVKYDLTGHARLVTVVNNGLCIFLFTGDHDAVDRWLDKNTGLDYVAAREGDAVFLEKVRASDGTNRSAGRISSDSDWSKGALIDLLPERYKTRLLDGLEPDVLEDVHRVESVADDDTVLSVVALCGDSDRQSAVMDVLLSLRSGDVANAKNRIDLYANEVHRVQDLPSSQVQAVQSSDAAVLVADVDPQLFQHFVETASFEKWMLYLHPAQRQYVDRDFNGPARMSGVSGSGKTCVVVHRALRLADRYSPEPVLVVTLSGALASLIDKLIDAQRGATRPPNLKVTSTFDLCFDLLMELEPEKRDYYTKRSVAKNPHSTPEHVDEVWHEFFNCETNNLDADVMFEVVQTLNARRVYANDYLRQEFDYIRSSFAPEERAGYLDMERSGRIVPLDERFRRLVLKGLEGWEKKMGHVGVIDDMGIVAALHRHIGKLKPLYRAALVDEVQDLGTLELGIVRALVSPGENDLFLCGDSAQTIYTKSGDLKLAGIDVVGRSVRLNQNYRNSRQILTAAHAVLTRALEAMPKGAIDIEVLEPEFANFSSPKPLLLSAGSLREEIEYALNFLDDHAQSRPSNQRHCLVFCGYGQAALEVIGQQLRVPVLAADTDLGNGRLFVSDLEQTKGFEFDAVVVVNCSAAVMPHPDLPPEESFRDLCRLYVAMTRAKTQLVLSYSGTPSPFVAAARDAFVESPFGEYAERAERPDLQLPPASIPKLGDQEAWARNGRGFLRSRDAVGLDRTLQDEILSHVTGIERVVGRERKQTEWRTFGGFAKAMEQPRVRHQVISEEAWANLSARLQVLRGAR